MTEPNTGPPEIADIHNILAESFTHRYIKKAHLSALAYDVGYSPDDPLCDYDTTWWPAAPVKHSERLAGYVLSGLFMMRPKTIDRVFYAPIDERADQITDTLRENPVMAIVGHSPDLLGVLPLHGISKAVAKSLPGDYRRNLHEMFNISHVVATRGFVPLKLRLPEVPGKPNLWTLLRAARLILNPHFTFPRTEIMLKSGIPEEFIDEYNARARADCLAAVRQAPEHSAGLSQTWMMAPGGAPDLKGRALQDKYPDVSRDMQITRSVSMGTIKLVQQMGCTLLPVRSSLGQAGPVMELGQLIPPENVNDATLSNIMADLAEFRRDKGETNVYYEEEL